MIKTRLFILLLLFMIWNSFAQVTNHMDTIIDMRGNQVYDRFGYRLEAMDFNADGYQDLMVLQPRWVPDSLDAQIGEGSSVGRNWGRILFYYGGPDFDDVADFAIEGERPHHYSSSNYFLNLGDVNGDGYEDLGTYTYPSIISIFYGGPNPSSSPGYVFDPVAGSQYYFSIGFSALGDINGDGYDDFSYWCYPDVVIPGFLRIVLGGSFQEITVAITTEFGVLSRVNGIGDINGDGYDDFVYSIFRQPGGIFYHQALLYYGGEDINLDDPIYFTEVLNYGGMVRKALGDINGDSYNDFVGLMDGTIKVWYGGETLSEGYDIILSPYYVGSYAFDQSLVHGDLNGDGISDVIGADPQYTGGSGDGRACVWIGKREMNGTADLFITGDCYQQLGLGIACGDFNDDGYDDLALAEPKFLDIDASFPGRVRVFAGNPDLCDTTVDINAEEQPAIPANWYFRALPNPVLQGRGIKIKFYGKMDSAIGDLSVKIYNLRGQEVFHDSISKSSIIKGEQDFGNLSLNRGVYIVSLFQDKQKIKSSKFTIK